ncbi:hypothetical protein EON65_36520, partial [archaeon]
MDSFSFLEVVVNVWQDYCEQMITIRNIFLYLDRYGYGIHNMLLGIYDIYKQMCMIRDRSASCCCCGVMEIEILVCTVSPYIPFPPYPHHRNYALPLS